MVLNEFDGYFIVKHRRDFSKDDSCNVGLMDNEKMIIKPVYQSIFKYEDIFILRCNENIEVVHQDDFNNPILDVKGKSDFRGDYIILQTKEQDYILDFNGNYMTLYENYDTYG